MPEQRSAPVPVPSVNTPNKQQEFDPPPPPKPKPENNQPIAGFLRQLLQKNLDTGDLIIVLLLLLIAGDSEENRTNALLTLALYFLL